MGRAVGCLLGKPFEEITDEEKYAFSLEEHVDPDSPPTFIWHTAQDKGVPVIGSLLLAAKLCENGVATCVGYGTTNVIVSYGDQQVTIIVRCIKK